MNPFQQLLRQQLDSRQWTQADLIRASRGALQKQTVSRWLAQPLRRMPSEASIIGLADAFSLHPDVVRRAAASSTGVPVAPVPIPTALDLADVPADVLILEIGRRIGATPVTAARAGKLAAYRPPGPRAK